MGKVSNKDRKNIRNETIVEVHDELFKSLTVVGPIKWPDDIRQVVKACQKRIANMIEPEDV